MCYRLSENLNLLKDRLIEIKRSQKQLEVDVQNQSQKSQKLMADMNNLKPELKRIIKQRDQTKV